MQIDARKGEKAHAERDACRYGMTERLTLEP